MEKKNSLVRDLVYVGVFGAIYTIIVFMLACLGYIPVCMPLLPFIMGIALGIPMFLFYSKIDRPLLGCFLVYFIFGLMTFLSGRNLPCFIAAMIAGAVVGIVLKSLPKNMKSLTIAYTISGIVPSSVILPLWVMHDEYIKTTSQMADQAYIEFLEKLSSSNWPIVGIYIGGFIGSFIGALIARRAMKKHFKRIGLV
ncbi:MAG: MptD family putative ECF transporter S component [Fibrobacter sp.]|nr:MptD family putative ECF transporter S component [Fibrobacter sp.]